MEPRIQGRVAFDALKGVKTIQQIAKEFDIPPIQVMTDLHRRRDPEPSCHLSPRS
jgi:hypothetical protein